MQYQEAKTLNNKKQKTKGVHPRLVAERKQCNFNQDQMCQVAHMKKHIMENFKVLRDWCAKDPIMQNELSYFDNEREEMSEQGFKKLNRIMKNCPIPIDYKNVGQLVFLVNGSVSLVLL